MLKTLRSLNFGWILIVMGLCAIGAGLNMVDPSSIGRTWLCFDKGCVTVQGVSALVLGVFIVIVGIVGIIRKW
ncbi:MAG: hypothetical protein AAGF87_12580 [Bacteroidota bacterium]